MDLQKGAHDLDRYLKESTTWMSLARLDYSLGNYFRGLDLSGKSVLEIGAGQGYASAWCVLHGAEEVVALEPEASGSTEGVQREFEKMNEAVDFTGKIKYLPITLKDYLAENKSQLFDCILMVAVINHLDEEATKRLHLGRAEAERQRYRDSFTSLYSILNPGGIVLIYDVGRRNFWHDLRLKNPFAPTIEYEKHQQPKMWNSLLSQCGFEFMDVRWSTLYKLRRFRRLLSHAFGAYFLSSGFILRCRKPSSSQDP